MFICPSVIIVIMIKFQYWKWTYSFPGQFPNFRSLYQSADGFGFEFFHPSAKLETEKFSINDNARNFPKEALERGLSNQVHGERRRRHIPGKQLVSKTTFID